MKLYFASQSFYPHIGGVSTSLLNLTRELSSLGNKVVEVHLRPSGEDNLDEIEGVEIHRAPKTPIDVELMKEYSKFKEAIYKESHFRGRAFSKPAHEMRGFTAFNKVNDYLGQELSELIKQEPADIVHVHDFQLLFAYRYIPRGTPLILSWHIPFIDDMSPALKKFLVQYLMEYDKVVFSSQEYIDAAVRAGLPRWRTELIPPIANTHLFGPRDIDRAKVLKSHGIPESAKVILCVQRVDPKSGHMQLIDSMPEILKKVPDAHLVFVGGESLSNKLSNDRAILARKIKDRVEELGLSKRVIWTGNVAYEQLPELYNASDLVTLCSKNEGFGLSLTEGMACGKPIVGTRTGGIPLQVEDGKNGFLVDVGDIHATATAISNILGNPKLSEKMGRKGMEVVEKSFTIERGLEKHLMLYNKVKHKKDIFYRTDYLERQHLRAIVTDLDRTIIDKPDGPTFNPKSFDAKLLKQMKETGLQIILATGRTLDYVTDMSDHFGIWDCIIAENGALVYLPKTKRILTTETAEMQEVKERITKLGLPDTEIGRVIVAINWKDRAKAKKALGKLAQKVLFKKNVDRLMIVPPGTDKGQGIRMALHDLGIEPDKTLLVGDGENDIDMFMNPGFKVALKNAHPELKKLANQVTKRPATKGIYEILTSLGDRFSQN